MRRSSRAIFDYLNAVNFGGVTRAAFNFALGAGQGPLAFTVEGYLSAYVGAHPFTGVTFNELDEAMIGRAILGADGVRP